MTATTPRSPRTLRATLGVTVLLVALSVAASPAAPAPADPGGPITEKYTISRESVQAERAFEAFDASAVSFYDLDGDGVTELIANNDNNRAYVFDGATGRLLLEITTPHPRYWDARELNGIAVGDVNGNARPDLVIANSASWVTALETDPPAKPDGDWRLQELWRTFIDPTELDPHYLDNRTVLNASWDGYAGLDGAAFLADATGDGQDEVFFQTDDAAGQYALHSNGSISWWHDWGDGNANPVVADLDGNDRYEAVFVTDGGRVFVYHAETGTTRCVFSAGEHGAEPGSISAPPTLVDVTGDERLDIVFGARQAVENENETWYKEQHAHYFAVDADCELVWAQQFEWANPHVYMRPAAVDLEGDGRMDLVIHDWNTIGHKPGDWQVTGPANLFVLDASTGALKWKVETTTYWSNKDIAIADVTGDDALEILVIAEQGGEDGVTLYDVTGARAGFLGAGEGWLVTRGPTVGDVDGDGLAEVVFAVHRPSEECRPRELDVGCREGAIRVFDTGRPANAPWSGNRAFNARVDHEGAAPTATAPSVDAHLVPGGVGVFAIRVPGAEDVYARRPDGQGEWHALDASGDTWTASVHPVNGESWRVRATLANGSVAFTTVEWHGEGPGRVEGRVEGTSPLGRATVHVEGSGVSKDVTTARGGAFTIDLEPGNYTFTPRADDKRGDAVSLRVQPGEVHEVALRLNDEPTGFGLLAIPFLGSAAALAGAAVLLGAVRVRLRKRRERNGDA